MSRTKRFWLTASIIFLAMGAAATVDTFSIPNATVNFGKNTSAAKRINFNNNLGAANPAIRMNSGQLEFSNDGVNFTPFSSGIPAGMIEMFGGTVSPTGWYACDGASKAVSTDMPIFYAIGTNYGSTDGVHPSGTLNGTSSVTVSSCTGVTAGFFIKEDAGFVPHGTTVVSCISTTLTMSAPATNSTSEVLTIAGHINMPKFQGLFPRGWDPTAINDPDNSLRVANNSGGNITTGLGSQQPDQFQSHTHSLSAQGSTASPNAAAGQITANTANNATFTAFTMGASGGNETRGKNLSVNFIIKR